MEIFFFQEHNFQNTFRTEKIILYNTGFFPYQDPGRYYWKIIRRLSVFISLVIFFGQTIWQAFYIDSNSLMEHSMIWVPEFGLICKMVVLIQDGDEILTLEDEFKKPTYSKLTKENWKALKNDINFTMRLTNIYRLVTVLYGTYVILLTPIINYKSQRILPLDAHTPCDLENDSCYFSFLTFQFIAGYISCHTNVNLDCLFCKLVTACCSLFDILQFNLSNMDYRSEEVAEIELRNNVVLHQKILR